MKLQEVRESALALPKRSREKLAQELAESVLSEEELDVLYSRGKFSNPPGSKYTEAEFNEEMRKRIKAHESGEDPGILWEDVLKEMRQRENGNSNRKRRKARI